MSQGEGGQTQTLILTFSFSVFVLTRACSLVTSSQLCGGYETPFRSSPQNGSRKFWPSSHRHGWCLTAVFTSSPLEANSFYVLYPAPTLNGFSLWVSSSQSESAADISWYISIFNLVACCCDDLDFENLPFSFLFVSPLTHIFLSFPLSRGGPVNLAKK